MTLFRSVIRLETLFVTLRQLGLSAAMPGADELPASQRLTDLLEQLRQVNHDIDWELTYEIVRLRDRCEEHAARYAKEQYGVAVGGHIRLPNALPGLPDKLRVSAVAFIDEPPHELRLEGHPVRTDGTVLSEAITMFLGPEGIKVHAARGVKRDRLRNRVNL